MFTPTCDTIDKQIQAWESGYDGNNLRGREGVRFSLAGEQWVDKVVSARINSSKESLTFNIMLKHLRKLKAQLREIEFTLDLYARDEDAPMEETHTFKILLEHIMLSKQVLDRLNECGDKCAEFGYAFGECNFEQDNDQTLCSSPILRMHQDPTVGFWDINAKHPCKTDGRFCGIKKLLSKDEFVEKYPEYVDDDGWLKESDNEVVDYWYRVKESRIFVALKGGVYKRQDLITEDDEVATKADTETKNGSLFEKPLEKTGTVDCIYFLRKCEDTLMVPAKEFPCDRLPMPYHPGFTVWTDEGMESYPFTYAMKGAQELLNFTQSQLATMIKNASGRLIVWDHKHVNGLEGQELEDIKNINQREGSVQVDLQGSEVPPLVLTPSDIPFALMEYANTIQQLSDDIAGSFVDVQNSDNTIVSGKALQEFTESMNVMQVGFMASHIIFVNEVAACFSSMIPKLYTEERTLVVNKKDGTSQPIMINKFIPDTNTIQNNIKDLSNNFIYQITAGPSTKMQKQTALKSLQLVMQADPQWPTLYGDLYARNLDFPDAQEFERRMLSRVDPNLVKYSQQQMTQADFLKYMQQKNAPQQQMQMQQHQAELQHTGAKAQREQAAGQADMIRAQNDSQSVNIQGQVAITNASNAQANTQIQAQKVMGEQQAKATQQALDETHMQYDREKNAYQHVSNMVGHAINATQAANAQQQVGEQQASPQQLEADNA